jgi:lipoprotein-releasing system ATP-binding protein
VVIRAEGVTKTFASGEGKLTVLADMDLEVRCGERLALVGESGTGKSTLLHLLGGLDRPTRGKIYFGSKEITALPDTQLAAFRNRDIGFVWQAHNLLPEFTALENVMMPLLVRGIDTADAVRPAVARLDEVGVSARASHRAGELSGGEQQRVALARALVGDPSFLLADEPTGNLDARTGEMIMNLLEELHEARGVTSILVTHNLSFARRCHRVLELDNGRLWPEGETPTSRMTPPRGGDHKTSGREYV